MLQFPEVQVEINFKFGQMSDMIKLPFFFFSSLSCDALNWFGLNLQLILFLFSGSSSYTHERFPDSISRSRFSKLVSMISLSRKIVEGFGVAIKVIFSDFSANAQIK